MNILDKILKQHSELYDPHKQAFESFRENKYLYITLGLMVVELFAAQYLISMDKYFIGTGIFIFFFMTVGVSTFYHLKLMENKYGSIENLDIERRNKLLQSILNKLGIDLTIENQNLLINEFIQEKLSKLYKKEQYKHSTYFGMFTIALPFFFSFVLDNTQNTLIMTSVIMLIGAIISIKSFKMVLQEYSMISKLEHISELLKEVRLSQLIDKSHLTNSSFKKNVSVLK